MKSGLKINLDDRKVLKELDKSDCYSSILKFPDQILSAFDLAAGIPVNPEFKNLSSVYYCGMGGSAYPGRIIKYLYFNSLKVPLEIVDNYELPASVNKNSLVFCASYSGNTEETLSCCRIALKNNLPVMGITSGGELAALLKSKNKTVFVFDPVLNPSNQPRLGQGYLIAGVLALFSGFKLIGLDRESINDLVDNLKKFSKNLEWDVSVSENSAKQLALKFEDKLIFLLASGFLEGAVHAVRNPLNETGKHFASYFIIPELNHHLLEGFAFPELFKNSALFTAINSSLYSPKIRLRLQLTKDVIFKNKIPLENINLKSKNSFNQAFELIQLLTFVSFYLACLHNIDPAPVPWVDYFKQKLKD